MCDNSVIIVVVVARWELSICNCSNVSDEVLKFNCFVNEELSNIVSLTYKMIQIVGIIVA